MAEILENKMEGSSCGTRLYTTFDRDSPAVRMISWNFHPEGLKSDEGIRRGYMY
jgi:hypothetical protein